MYTYLEMMNSVNHALANHDYDRLQRLRIMDACMFDEVIKEIEKNMGIKIDIYSINRFNLQHRTFDKYYLRHHNPL